ncbi:glycosyltransferase family 39 protein [Candidatus Microgenomates bacterium]|nr:glycosyltransferase family 39 protein [Candidatus Microgenomates bacterium]
MKKYAIPIILLILIIFYFATRLYDIMGLPLFTDEAIYVRWSQIARYDANWRFISLTDGKQPSFVWLTMTMMKFVQDPLLAGRLVSVMAGFISLIGLFFLGREIFRSTWVGIASIALYIIFPMALVYDRMALYDGLVGTFTIWGLYLQILVIRYLRLDTALLLGMVTGGGVLTKTSAFFSIYLLPCSLLLFNFFVKKRLVNFLRWMGLAVLAVILTYGYYSILRLSPFLHIINEKNSIFVYSFRDWLGHPWEFFWGNLLGEWDWFIKYVSWPVIALIAGSFLVYRQYTREKLLLLVWFAVPFVALALFGRVLYPRFIFFMILPLLPLAALSFIFLATQLKKTLVVAILAFLLLLISFRTDYFILTDFARAPVPFQDLEQYINSWPAGGGLREIIAFLDKQAQKGKIYVASEGTFGSLPTYGVEIYLGDNKNVEKRGIWPLPKEGIEANLQEKAKTIPVYFIFNQTQVFPDKWPITFIARYQKGVGNSYMSLYQVNP